MRSPLFSWRALLFIFLINRLVVEDGPGASSDGGTVGGAVGDECGLPAIRCRGAVDEACCSGAQNRVRNVPGTRSGGWCSERSVYLGSLALHDLARPARPHMHYLLCVFSEFVLEYKSVT